MNRTRKASQQWLTVLAVAILLLCVFDRTGYAMDKPQLKPCPQKNNCVNSKASSSTHAINPFAYQGDAIKAMQTLVSIIEQQPRTSVLTNDGRYVHSTFTSLIFRFVDDVEFLLDEKAGVIQVRSASRVGESDFGVNRRRVEKLRELFDKAMKETGS